MTACTCIYMYTAHVLPVVEAALYIVPGAERPTIDIIPHGTLALALYMKGWRLERGCMRYNIYGPTTHSSSRTMLSAE